MHLLGSELLKDLFQFPIKKAVTVVKNNLLFNYNLIIQLKTFAILQIGKKHFLVKKYIFSNEYFSDDMSLDF